MKKILLLVILAIVSCKSLTEESDHGNTQEPDQHITKIDSLFNSEIAKNEPGAAIFASYGDEVLVKKTFGLSDLEHKVPITDKTNFRTGSISKQFTALSVLCLIEKGLLSTKDSIYNYWNYPIFKDITVEHILNHTSGLPDYSECFEKSWNRDLIVENKDILEWLSTNANTIFKPGTDFEYCNTGYILLASLVEKISGESFATYGQNNIFKKSNMESTAFYSLADPIEIKERPYCYEKDSLGNWERVDGDFMDEIMGGGGMYTNIDDFYKYNIALDNQSILSKDMHGLIFKPNSPLIPKDGGYIFDFLHEKQQHYGMGWFLTDKTALHGGSWNGARAMVVKDLDRPLTIAMFLNFDSSEIRNELTESTYDIGIKYL